MLEDLEWFHPGASRHVAECLLMQNGSDGSYLLRPSSQPDSLALSVRSQDSVKHFHVDCLNEANSYQLGMTVFSTVAELVEHFRCNPMLAGESGLLTVLKYPYPRVVSEPPLYEVIRIQALMGSTASNDPSNRKPLAMSSKEGFLSKRGGRFKSWRTRWCLVRKMEFRYFENRFDFQPIKVLDLQQCVECTRVSSMGRVNCFRLVFLCRTEYFCASTPAEADEWINLIQWKLTKLAPIVQPVRCDKQQFKRWQSESALDKSD